MSSVTDTTTTDTTNTQGPVDTSLIDFMTYYDEFGNLVTADGYLLDADGNLVVSADSELTGAYSVVGADGVTYYVDADASIINGAILSSVDESKDSVLVDSYGNAVTTDGHVLDQSDSDGNTILSVTSGYTISSKTFAEATDSDGNAVTITSGSGYSFTTADSAEGTVYAQATAYSASYYDSYGTLVDSDGNLINEDETTFSTTDVTAASYYYETQTDGSGNTSGTYYWSLSATTSGGGSYYALASGDASQVYLGGVAVTDGSYVYYSTGGTYYLLGDSVTAVAYNNDNDGSATPSYSAASVSAGIGNYAIAIDSLSDATSTDSLVYVEFTSVTTGSDATTYYYTVYYGGYTEASGLDRYTLSTEIDGSLYYFASSTTIAVTSTTSYSFSDQVASTAVSESAYTLLLSTLAGSGLSADIALSVGSFGDEYSALFDLGTYYLHSDVTVSAGTATAASTATLTLYKLIASASSLATDASGSDTLSSVATTADMLYKGYELYYDEQGAWVTASASGGSVYYLVDSDCANTDIDLRLLLDATDTTAVTTVYTYSLNGNDYIGTDDDGDGYYTFTSSVDSDATVYADTSGFLTDSDGYIIDETGEKQELTEETLYTYTQYVEKTDSDGNGTGEYSTYYYYFGSTVGTDYYDSDAGITTYDSDGNEDGTVYQVLTDVRGTIYYDAHGNTVNAAGYLMDASTFDLIYTSATELTAGYSFTSIDGITYIVSGQATIDTVNGTFIVYSGVSETRYYGDANDNGSLDKYDTEYTADELWIIIRDDAGEILTYQSVEDGTEYSADEWPGSDTATADAEEEAGAVIG